MPESITLVIFRDEAEADFEHGENKGQQKGKESSLTEAHHDLVGANTHMLIIVSCTQE